MFSQQTRPELASGVTVLDVVDVIDGILIHGISFPTCSGAGIITHFNGCAHGRRNFFFTGILNKYIIFFNIYYSRI